MSTEENFLVDQIIGRVVRANRVNICSYHYWRYEDHCPQCITEKVHEANLKEFQKELDSP